MKPQKSILQQIAPYSADVLDPLILRRSIPFYQKLKSIIVSVTFLPIRILVMFSLLFFAWILGVSSLRGLPEEEKIAAKPLSGWRRKWMKPFICEIARLIFVVGGWHWIPTKGKRASPKEAPILVLVPHSSFWDTVPVIALRCPCLVVKDSTESAPFFGALVNYTQPVYVKRDDPQSRQRTVDQILRRCRSEDDWEQILIFPEGACGNRQALLDFKLGAFYPGVPVQPVFIRYPNKLDTITWTWDGPGLVEQMWLTLTQLHVYCELEFLPVYYPSETERKDPRIFARNLRRSISRMCDIPLSCFSLDDVKYLNIAKANKLPKTIGLVKLLRLRQKTGHEAMTVETELATLSLKLALQKNTTCDLRCFAKYLDVPVSEAVKDFFNLFDQEKKGEIDVRCYNAGLWLLKTELSEWKRLEYGFKVFNPEGVITAPQFAVIAFLWRGLPQKVAMDIFYVFNFDNKEKYQISFKKFKSVATSFVHLENSLNKKYDQKNNGLKSEIKKAS